MVGSWRRLAVNSWPKQRKKKNWGSSGQPWHEHRHRHRHRAKALAWVLAGAVAQTFQKPRCPASKGLPLGVRYGVSPVGSGRASSSVTRQSLAVRALAAAQPAQPAPTTTT